MLGQTGAAAASPIITPMACIAKRTRINATRIHLDVLFVLFSRSGQV